MVFGTFCAAMFIHIFFLFPETAGKTLEEVEDLFTDPKGPKYIGTLAWKTRVSNASTLEHGDFDEEKLAAVHREVRSDSE